MSSDKFPPDDIRFISTNPQNSLSRDDLFLMLKSYENYIQQNTIVLGQQKQILDKQDHLLKKQSDLCNGMSEIIGKLGTYSDKIIEMKDGVSTNVSDIKIEMTKNRLAQVKEYSGLNLKMYVAWGGTAIVILSLISLLHQFAGPLKTSISLIAKHLGVG